MLFAVVRVILVVSRPKNSLSMIAEIHLGELNE